MSGDADQLDRMKVFVSYSRGDVAFADQLVVALEDRGFDAILDRHDIDAAENWRARLGGLILSCDAVAFVLTEKSAASPICVWEVEEAKKLGKRIVPCVPGEVSAVTPAALADLNWIHFYSSPAIPGSGMFDGMRKLDRALKVDLSWLREQTRLSEQADIWRTRGQHGAQTPADSSLLLRGQALEDALAWAQRAPANSHVPQPVSHYLEVSAANEVRLKAEAQAGLAEREQALKRAEEAMAQSKRAMAASEAAMAQTKKAQARVQFVSVVSLIIGVVLIGLALVGGWFAASNYVNTAEMRSQLFAREAKALIDESKHAKAMLMTLYGDPEAHDGWVERVLRPEGYATTRAALSNAFGNNLLAATFQGHEGALSAVALHPDGEHRVTGTDDGAVSVWRIGEDKPLATFAGHDDAVFSVAVHPDGERFLTGSYDHTARLWRIGEPKPLATFVRHGGALSRRSPSIPTVSVSSPGLQTAWPGCGGSGRRIRWRVSRAMTEVSSRSPSIPTESVSLRVLVTAWSSSGGSERVGLWRASRVRTVYGRSPGIVTGSDSSLVPTMARLGCGASERRGRWPSLVMTVLYGRWLSTPTESISSPGLRMERSGCGGFP